MSQARLGNVGDQFRRLLIHRRSKQFGVALAVFAGVTLVVGLYWPQYFFKSQAGLFGGDASSVSLWTLANGMRKWSTLKLNRFFDGNIYYPLAGTVTLGDHFLLPSLALWPLKALAGSLQSAYNGAIFMLFGVNAAAFAWSLRLLGAPWVTAAFGALIFSINGYRWINIPNFESHLTFFFPALMLFFEKARGDLNLRNVGFLAGSILLLALSSRNLFLISLPALLAFVALLMGKVFRDRRLLTRIWPWAVGLALILLLWSRPYYLSGNWFEWAASNFDLSGHSNRWISVFDGRRSLKLASLYTSKQISTGGMLFLGLVEWAALLSCLVLVGIRFWKRQLSLKTSEGQFLGGLLVFLGVYFLASMGPSGDGEVLDFNMFRLLAYLPGVATIREPAQLSIVIHLLIATLVALSWGYVWTNVATMHQKKLKFGLVGVALLYLGEMIPSPLPSEVKGSFEKRSEGLIRFLHKQKLGAVVAILPNIMGHSDQYLLPSLVGNPVLGGIGDHANRDPAIYREVIRPRLDSCDTVDCVEFLRQLGVSFVVVYSNDQGGPAKGTALERLPGLKKVYEELLFVVFEVQESIPWKKLVNGNQGFLKKLLPWQAGICSAPKEIRVSSRPEKAAFAHDGMFGTIWLSDSPQGQTDSWIDLDIPDELAGVDLIVEAESGFDGDIRHGMYGRTLRAAKLTEKGPVPILNAATRLFLKEPFKLVEQILIPTSKGEKVKGFRITAQKIAGAQMAWGVGEIRLCRASVD